MTITNFTDAVNITGNLSNQTQPIGNGTTSGTLLSAQGNTSQDNQREFLAVFGMNSNHGSGATNNNQDKVTLYAGMVALPGTGDVWSINSVLIMYANTGSYNAQGYELDFNNNNAHRGDATDGTAFAAPVAYGLTITGAGTYRSTSAMLVSGPGTPIWNRGIVFANNSVSQANIQDFGNAATSIDIRGSHYIALDTVYGVFSGGAIRVGNNQKILGLNAAGTANLSLLNLNASNLFIGDPALQFVYLQSSTVPSTDGVFLFGAPTARWAAGYFASGTFTTSDASVKANIKPLSDVFPVLDLLEPVQFTRTDGQEMVETEEEQTVQDTEWTEADEIAVELRDGKPVQVTKKVRRERHLNDEVPVLDEAGNPVLITKPAKDAVLNDLGEVVQPAEPERITPLTHPVPRMVTKMVKVQKPAAKVDNAVHFGFLADNVKAAVAPITQGSDFGGHVTGEDGKAHLNLEQLIGVAIQACKQLRAENAELRTRLDAIEAK